MTRNLALALLSAALLSLSGAAKAGVIFADNFDAENGGAGALNYSSFANWTVSNGTVDLIGNGFADLLPGNGLYVDLDGSSVNAGVLTKTAALSLSPGTYTLKFALAGSQRGDTNTVVVTFGSLFTESFVLGSGAPFAMITRTVAVGTATSAALSFENLGGDNVGALLDNVSVSTPEPGILGVLGFGLVALALARRSRRRSLAR
ncbi:MAG: PEP-CTERM sorting domain-containing protein [Betaproteobacteria bacterium]